MNQLNNWLAIINSITGLIVNLLAIIGNVSRIKFIGVAVRRGRGRGEKGGSRMLSTIAFILSLLSLILSIANLYLSKKGW